MTRDNIDYFIKTNIKRFMSIPLIYYLFNSILVTIIDILIVWILYRILHIDLLISNTSGVITGFIIHYILSVKAVFRVKYDLISFLIYLGTFFIGLVFADWLIYIGENRLFLNLNANISFLLSKGISVVLPFFLLYLIRRLIFYWLKDLQDRKK
ncbi:MAG: hypothetical protein EWM47_11275 [Anaerolineaceae bacterium]|nr:MAG: hypothetical protein EWM47_11275 [Anaerolineaceae bacterium]